LLASARARTPEDRFREGVELSEVGRKLFLLSPFRRRAEEALEREEIEEHCAQLLISVPKHA
jgi:hypothetical protein